MTSSGTRFATLTGCMSDEEVHKVQMKTVHDVLVNEGGNTDCGLATERVLQWNHRMYAIEACADGTPALFVPTSFLRLDMDDDDMSMVPDKLVLLLPAGVQTQMSTAE